MRRERILAVLIIIMGFCFMVPSFAHDHHSHHAHNELDENRSAPLPGSSLYQLGSSWKTQDGQSIQLAHFKSQPLVLTMAYTRCQAACPMLVSDMKRIEEALPAELKSKVRFALVSFDSKRDSPETLKEYAKSRGLDPKNWTLLTSSEASVRQLAAALGVRYKQDAQGEFSHSNVITILNSKGEILHQQVGLRADPKESIEALKAAQ